MEENGEKPYKSGLKDVPDPSCDPGRELSRGSRDQVVRVTDSSHQSFPRRPRPVLTVL